MFNNKKLLAILESLGFVLLLIFMTTLLSNLYINKTNNTLISYSFITLLISILYRRKILSDAKTFIKDIKENKNTIFISILLILLQIAITILFNINSSANDNSSYYAHIPIYAVMLVTLIPICEELIVRLPFHKCNNISSFLIYSTIFVLLHLISNTTDNMLLCSVPYILLSLGISINYIKTNNILVSISTHIINNLIVLMILFI